MWFRACLPPPPPHVSTPTGRPSLLPLLSLTPLSLCVCVRMVLESYLLSLCSFLHSDYIIEEKNAVLQKKENEGFGFVLRGAKGEQYTHTDAHLYHNIHRLSVFSLCEGCGVRSSFVDLGHRVRHSRYCYCVSQQHNQLWSTVSLYTQMHSGFWVYVCV